MRKSPTTSPRRNRGRTALLTSAATLAVVMATPALAQQTVILQEGATAPGSVALDGIDRLVLDISRVNGNTGEIELGVFNNSPKLLEGDLTSAGGADTVWLRATSSKTANVAWPYSTANHTTRPLFADQVQFTGGVVYEASGNDTVLVLENRSRAQGPTDNQAMPLYDAPLRLAGDGRIDLTFSVSGDQAGVPDRAIVIEKGSTSQGGDGKLDVWIRRDITTFDNSLVNGVLDPNVAAIDARNANSITFKQQADGYVGSARMAISATTGVLGGEADIFIERDAYLAVRGDQEGLLIRTSGRVDNRGRLDGTGNDPSVGDKGIGVMMEGASLLNTFTESQPGEGIIYGGWAGVVAASGDNLIDNGALIQSRNKAAIESRGGSVVTRNRSHTLGSRTNAGRIIGGMVGTQQIAYEDIGETQDLIVNSSTITGDVLMGAGSDTFLYTGTTNGVGGTIYGGGDLTDAYGRSVSASGTFSFANDLNTGNVTGFNMHGLELNGSNLAVMLEGAGGVTLTNGIKVLGAGTVTNNAKINDADGYGVVVEHFAQLNTAIDFANTAEVRADRGFYAKGGLTRFLNKAGGVFEGTAWGVGIIHEYDGGKTLDFTNDGLIANSGGDAGTGALILYMQDGEGASNDTVMATVRNTGTIRNTYISADVTQQATRALLIGADIDLGRITFDNSGTIEALGAGGLGTFIENIGFIFTNSGKVQSLGAGGGGFLINNASNADYLRHVVNTSTGVIRANEGGALGGQGGRSFAFGIGANTISNDSLVQIDNAGLIEATGANSIAVAAIGVGDVSEANFTLNNTGVIRGGDDTIVAEDEGVADTSLKLQTVLGDADEERVVAGAIQTWRTTDIIRNAASGQIFGSIDLGLGDDRLENYGSIDGNIRMGEGADTFVLGGGSIAAGRTVSGGADHDVLLADMSSNTDKVIDGAIHREFEVIRRMAGSVGSGKLFVRGGFGNTMELDDVAIHIALGDQVSALGFFTFLGGLNAERINNAGTIVGRIGLGGGDDLLENSGTIDGSVHMGDDNDEVFNSGVITGDLDLGDGDDRYEAIGAGIVMGDLDGGLGNDTLVFRLNNQTTSIPNGFDGFESFAAYGPGTLQLALNRPIETLEILDGANLELTNASAYSVGLIRGDDKAQSVKIDAGFTGSVELLGGDDTLEMSLNGLLSGDLDGGDGTDLLKLNLTGASTINDLFNFENVEVTGASPLTLEGTLGAGQKITFDNSNNHFILAEGAVFNGQADGGDGTDTLYVETAGQGERVLVEGQLTSFEQFQADGDGAVEFRSGTYDFLKMNINQNGEVVVGPGAILSGGANGVVFGNGFNRFTMTAGGKLNGRVDGGLGDDTLAFAQGEGKSQKLSDVDAVNFEFLAASGAGELHIDKDATFTGGVLLEGGTVVLDQNFTLTADVIGGAGNDTFDNGGTVDGDILLGGGDDTYVARTGSGVTAGHTINGGAGGNDTVVFNLNDGIGSLSEDYVDFESVGVYGPGTLEMDLTENFISIKLMENANLNLTSSGGTVGLIEGDSSAQTVTIAGGLTGGVKLGGGNDTLNLTLGGVLSGDLDGGAGDNDVLNLSLTSESRINRMKDFEVANVVSLGYALTLGGLDSGQRLNFLGTSDDELIIAAGAEFKGTVDGGGGYNLLRILSGASDSRTVVASQIVNFDELVAEGAGTLALTGGIYAFESVEFIGGNLELGADTTLKSGKTIVFDDGDNRLTLGSGAKIEGEVDAGDGAGVDTLGLIQDQGFTRNYSTLNNLKGFEALAASGAGELRFDVDAAFADGVSLNGGTTTVMANMTLTADVQGGDAADTFAILGKVNGDVNLGAGDDRLILTGADGSGLRSGGAGDGDILDFRTDGSYATPTVYDASRYDGFEKLAVSGGVVSMTSNSSWKGLSLTGGRLIGQAGTVLTSETAIDVGVGATFGSAGTVNADINVKGTLSPGASPGTMTVNGNVSFAKGSNLYLEVSPSLSDLLKINGKMSIADGAMVDITGLLENTPGAVLDLVVASGGIEGRFTTINKSNSIFGFVAQNGNKLQIRGEFQNDNAYGTNAQRSIAYANAVLGSGQAVQAFTQAVPVLVDANGVSNAAAFEQLTPEAYGSALRIGGETALAIVDSARGLDLAAPETEGFYSFAQGFGLRTELDARARTGAASAELDMGGVLGGVGYSTGTGATAGGFIGGTTAEQRLEELDATTRSDGVLVGAFAGATYAGVNVNGLVVYDQTEARTLRNMVATPDFARGRYDLTTWTADVSVDYAMSIGGVSVIPTAGVTWVSTERDTVSEAGGGAFALMVDGDRKDGWFADAGVKVTTAMMFEGRAFIPYAEAGVRKVLSDDGQRVTGALTGVEDLQLDVHGVRRDRTVARLAAGFTFEVDPAVTFSAGYAGEYGDNTRHNVSAGVSLKF